MINRIIATMNAVAEMLALRRIRLRISIRVFCSEKFSRVTEGVLGGFIGRDGLVGLVHITFKIIRPPAAAVGVI